MNLEKNKTKQQLLYPDSGNDAEGLFAELPGKLALVIPFDRVSIAEAETSKRATLWFRAGAKRLFHVRLVRKSGRCLIEMGGLNPGEVLRGIQICRDHCDRFFGIDAIDVLDFEGKLNDSPQS